MNIVCFDTQIVIWAIKEEHQPEQAIMVKRAKHLLSRLDDGAKKIMLPSIVVGEMLIMVPAEAHQTTTNLIERSFMVAHFDVRAAAFYAKIWRAKSDPATIDQLKADGKTRQELKADRMIVATALANGAECIYSHDRGVKVFGDGFIDVRCVPDMPIQGSMF